VYKIRKRIQRGHRVHMKPFSQVNDMLFIYETHLTHLVNINWF